MRDFSIYSIFRLGGAASRRAPMGRLDGASVGTRPRRVRWPIGLIALAVAAVLWGGDKPEPPTPPRTELVIIIEPIADGMYSTRYLHIERNTLNEIQNNLAD